MVNVITNLNNTFTNPKNEVSMAIDEKHKQVNLDIDTYDIIKTNAVKNHRSIAGEIRQMLEIVSGFGKDEVVMVDGIQNKLVSTSGSSDASK